MWYNGNNNRVIDSVNDNKNRVYVKKNIYFFHVKDIYIKKFDLKIYFKINY